MATELTVERKRYSTRYQRELLESVGVAHQRGRSFDEADRLIESLIEEGRITRCKDGDTPASNRQLDFLTELGEPVRRNMSRTAAKQLIDRGIERRDQARPMTDAQACYIDSLGGIPSDDMSLYEASQFIDLLIDNDTHYACCNDTVDPGDTCGECGTFVLNLPAHPPTHIYQRPGKPSVLERVISWLGG